MTPQAVPRMTAYDATLLRRRWKLAGFLTPDETDRALAELERALQDLERARRILAEQAAGPWPTVKGGLLELAEWARDEFGRLPDEEAPPAAPGRATRGSRRSAR